MEFKIYTVSFFGHRFIEANKQTEIEKELDILITDLIVKTDMLYFLSVTAATLIYWYLLQSDEYQSSCVILTVRIFLFCRI